MEGAAIAGDAAQSNKRKREKYPGLSLTPAFQSSNNVPLGKPT